MKLLARHYNPKGTLTRRERLAVATIGEKHSAVAEARIELRECENDTIAVCSRDRDVEGIAGVSRWRASRNASAAQDFEQRDALVNGFHTIFVDNVRAHMVHRIKIGHAENQWMVDGATYTQNGMSLRRSRIHRLGNCY
jgi:hypothetical protein